MLLNVTWVAAAIVEGGQECICPPQVKKRRKYAKY